VAGRTPDRRAAPGILDDGQGPDALASAWPMAARRRGVGVSLLRHWFVATTE